MASPLVRYGMKLRRLVKSIEALKKANYVCANCGKKKVKRIGFARYLCKSCGAEFAGAAYSMSSNLGELVKKTLAQYSKIK